MKIFFHSLVLFIFLGSRLSGLSSDAALYQWSANTFDETFSTNWLAAVKSALPLAATNDDFTFQQATNLLRQASERGDNAARGLWGFVLLVTSQSPTMSETGFRFLRQSAVDGNVAAMLQLGLLYSGGKFIRQNYNESFRWFSAAAAAGNSEAELQLGGSYHYGLGTTPDFEKAANCYRRSSEQTNFVAMKSYGYLLMNGLGCTKDLEAAKYWLTRSAKEGGNRRAMNNLGALYSLNFPDTNSLAQAFQWFKQGADLDDAMACWQLAGFYYRGWGGTETNFASYRYWILKAATLGATDAQYNMAVAYRVGDGVPADITTALVWCERAAAKNHPRALYDLALHYLEVKTNRPSLVLADRYLFLAAQAGHREAQMQYAMSCFRGDVVAAEFENGKNWLAKAASAGWAKAEFALFCLQYNGIAPAPNCPPYPVDKTEAVKWLRLAAEHESLPAQAILAVMLIQGKDVAVDKIAAEKLLRAAASHGFGQAQNDLGFAILDGDVAAADGVEPAMWCKLAQFNSKDPNVISRARFNLSQALSKLNAEQRSEVDRRVDSFKAIPAVEVDPMSSGWEKNPAYQLEDGQFGH